MSLQTAVGRLTWPTPIGLASGTCGYGSELEGLIDWTAVGAIFTKGISLEPRAGHPPPRIYETPSGMLNAIGLENVGLEAFVRDKLTFLAKLREAFGIRVFANLFGTDVSEYVALARALEAHAVCDGVELNLSCPNVQHGGLEFGQSATGCETVTQAVRKATSKFLVVKLSPASPVREVARAAENAGADALSTGNTMPAAAFDIRTGRPRLSATVGGLSGPALKPIALRMTYEAAESVRIPIIGVGGICCAADVLEFRCAGATAVQVGTATFANPNAAGVIRDELLKIDAPRQGDRCLS